MQADMPLPKYHQIYLVLKEGLLEGKFAQGMPGEISLVQQFGVARVTVRKALELLSSEGLITRQRGRGTVVKPVALSSPRSGRRWRAAQWTHGSARQPGEYQHGHPHQGGGSIADTGLAGGRPGPGHPRG
jgi:DNA-binding FadR family transcriptional regulator